MAGWTAAAIVGSAYLGSQAAGNAADTQAAATGQAAQLSNEQFQQTRQDQMPWLQAGGRALTKLEGAVDYTPFAYDEFTKDPGYAFRLKEGQKALDAQAAARGGLISGNALRAAMGYGQEMGSQEYQNAFNRYQQERAAKLQPLQSLAGVGQTTAANLGAAGAANAGAVGNYLTGGAAASAAGQVGAANAVSGGLGTYLNYNQGNNLVSALRQNQYNRPAATGQFESDINTYGFNG
ncbi:MAG: hypothetical protein ACR2IJ_01395 [Fluviibacter sp.]